MGSIIFAPRTLADALSDVAGYKAGLALSIAELCDHLQGTPYPDMIRESEESHVRLHSTEYESLFYKLLHRIGYTREEYDGDYTGAKRFHKYRRDPEKLKVYEGVLELWVGMANQMIDEAKKNGSKKMDPRAFVRACAERYGRPGYEMAMEQLEVLNNALSLSPHSVGRAVEWTSALALKGLIEGTGEAPQVGRYIDQRFVNYLAQNADRLPEMHWRKFEELAAEFFQREGFKVELGPGANDDGVDVRIWAPDAAPGERPLCLVQCKRQKAKVEKVVVKGLYSDVEYEGASYGVLVTTSELAPGARATIEARGYPIREVNREGVVQWLGRLRTPGTGIVRV